MIKQSFEHKAKRHVLVTVGDKQLTFVMLNRFCLVVLSLLYSNDLPDNAICDISIYADDTTLYSKCDWASDLWQQLELASELDSDL